MSIIQKIFNIENIKLRFKNRKFVPKQLSPQISDRVEFTEDKRADKTPVTLSVCSIFKNEPDIREWIEFHKMLGVERFYLFDNE